MIMDKSIKKEAYYFSHDSNSKDDEKIIRLRIKFGWEGYGIFWALIEKLRDSTEYKMQLDYEGIAFALQSDYEKIKSIINDFDLFKFSENGDFFYSKSLLNRMKIKEQKSENGTKAAKIRWENQRLNANALQSDYNCNTNVIQGKEKKGKKIKVNESKEKENEKKVNEILNNKSENFKLVFDNFLDMRIKKKAPMTQNAKFLILNELKNLSSDEQVQIKILNQSIMKTWSGVFPLKQNNSDHNLLERTGSRVILP